MSFLSRLLGSPVPQSITATKAQVPSAPPQEAGMRTLRRGMSGPDVAWLQTKLGEASDGIFGPATADALVAWQADQKLVADGVAGPATWRAMGLMASTAEPVFVAPGAISGSPQAKLAVQVSRALRAVGATDPAGWAAVIAQELVTDESPRGAELAAFLSNIINETGGLSLLVENLYYSKPESIQKNWPRRFPTLADAAPFARNAWGLGEKVYGGRMGNGPTGSGDGYKYRGHGAMQTTGKTNLSLLANALGLSIEELLPLLTQRVGAIHSALFFWRSNRIGDVFRAGGAAAARRAVNGGDIGLAEVMKLYPTVLSALEG